MEIKEQLKRINKLVDMDNWVRENHITYNQYIYWLQEGVPDGYDIQDLVDISEDNESYNWCIKVFNRIQDQIFEMEVRNAMKGEK